LKEENPEAYEPTTPSEEDEEEASEEAQE